MRTVQLDEVTIAHLKDLDDEKKRAMQQAAMQAAGPYALQAHAVLQHFIRLNKLEGDWKLSEDNKSITSDTPNIAQRSTRKKK